MHLACDSSSPFAEDPTGFFFSKLWNAIKNFVKNAFKAIKNIIKKALANPIVRAVIQILACAGPQSAVGTCAAVAAGLSAAATWAVGGSLGDAIKAAAFAAVSVYIWQPVGTFVKGLKAAAGAAFGVVKGAIHGVVGGALSLARGGSFMQGFAASAVAGAVGVYSDVLSQGNMLLDTVISAATGCASAALAGGQCANGAVTAAMANLYNKLGDVVRAGGEFAASFIPGVGEAQDLSVIFGAGYSVGARLLATASLGINVVTGGLAPNIGGTIRAGRTLGAFCSFDGETLVKTRRGLVPIKDITPSTHMVWARNEETGEMGWKEVRGRFVNPHDDQVHLTIAHNDNGKRLTQTIVTTREHPFFVKGAKRPAKHLVAANDTHVYGDVKGGWWIEAEKLAVGQQLMTASGGMATVASVAIEDTPIDAYNLTVADWHTFFVKSGDAGSAANDNASAVWVHNSKPCLPDLPTLDKSGKVHGSLPKAEDLSKYPRDELESLQTQLRQSVQRRIEMNSQLGPKGNHGLVRRHGL